MDCYSNLDLKLNQLINARIQVIDDQSSLPVGLTLAHAGYVVWSFDKLWIWNGSSWGEYSSMEYILHGIPYWTAIPNRTIFVSKEYLNVTNPQSPFFATIQSAVDFAESQISKGYFYTIFVYPGTYQEQIRIEEAIHVYCFPGVIIQNPGTVDPIAGAVVWMNAAGATFTGYAVIRNSATIIGEIYINQDCSFECDTIEYTGTAAPFHSRIEYSKVDMRIRLIKTILNVSASAVGLHCHTIYTLVATHVSDVTIEADSAYWLYADKAKITGTTKYFFEIHASAETWTDSASVVLHFLKNIMFDLEGGATKNPVKVQKSSYVELIDGTIETISNSKDNFYAHPVLLDGEIDPDNKDDPNALAICRLKHVRLAARDVDGSSDQVCAMLNAKSLLILDACTLVSSGAYSVDSDGNGSDRNRIKNYFSVANKDVGPDIAVLVRNPILIDPEVE